MPPVRNTPAANAGPALDERLAEAKGAVLDAFAHRTGGERDAVQTAFVERWTSGHVEGRINRL